MIPSLATLRIFFDHIAQKPLVRHGLLGRAAAIGPAEEEFSENILGTSRQLPKIILLKIKLALRLLHRVEHLPHNIVILLGIEGRVAEQHNVYYNAAAPHIAAVVVAPE